MNRILYIVICVALGISTTYAKKQPSWVNERPNDTEAYVAISSSVLTMEDYEDRARLSALNDIASQISVNIESESLLQSVDIDGKAKQIFEQKVKETLGQEITCHELVDTYKDKTHYYVYYKLDKQAYKDYIDAQRKSATQMGLDLLSKGRALEVQGDLIAALSLYIKGLESIEPYLHLKLEGMYSGRYINVANELYTSYKSIFAGMALASNVKQLSVETLKSTREPIAVCLSKNGRVVPNMPISAKFVSGAGEITPMVKSDHTGTAIFYVTNVTSKSDIQRIDIAIDDSFLSDIPELYRALIDTSTLPLSEVTLVVASPMRRAYFEVKNNDLPQCEGQVRSIFANNYFELTDESNVDIYIEYSTEFSVGEEVAGELYMMNECFCSMSIKIYNNSTKALLAEYAIPTSRVLVAASQSYDQAVMNCSRELMKQFKTRLPEILKGIQM